MDEYVYDANMSVDQGVECRLECRLEERLATIVGQLNSLHAELVDLIGEVAATDAWHGAGVRSLTHWLTWQAGVSSAHAKILARLVDARVTHPSIMRAFAHGELTLDQAAVAVRVPAALDAEIADMAKVATVSQLHTIVRAARPPVEPTEEDRSESFDHHTDDDGGVRIGIELDADHGAVFRAALEAARDRLFQAGATRVTWIDALIELCEHSLDAEQHVARRERFRINWFFDPAADQRAAWSDGSAIPEAIRRHLDCDGMLTPTFVAGGQPVSVGRSQRIVPDRTRRLVERRDGGVCRVPWCSSHRWLQIHHVVHWEDGGPTDTANLCALCPACHRAHHRGELGIVGNADQPDGLRFTDRHGHPLAAAPRTLQPVMPPAPPRSRYEHPLGERLYRRWLTFDHPADAPPAAA